jgi:hypothetical protein
VIGGEFDDQDVQDEQRRFDRCMLGATFGGMWLMARTMKELGAPARTVDEVYRKACLVGPRKLLAAQGAEGAQLARLTAMWDQVGAAVRPAGTPPDDGPVGDEDEDEDEDEGGDDEREWWVASATFGVWCWDLKFTVFWTWPPWGWATVRRDEQIVALCLGPAMLMLDWQVFPTDGGGD